MRTIKPAPMFVGAVLISTALFGIMSTPALFIFGFAWLVFGED